MALIRALSGSSGGGSIEGVETISGSYTYGLTPSFTIYKKDGTTATSNTLVQGEILKFQDRSSGGFKYTLTALAPCYVKGAITIGGTTVGSFDGKYPAGDIQVYNTSTQSGTELVNVVGIEM